MILECRLFSSSLKEEWVRNVDQLTVSTSMITLNASDNRHRLVRWYASVIYNEISQDCHRLARSNAWCWKHCNRCLGNLAHIQEQSSSVYCSSEKRLKLDALATFADFTFQRRSCLSIFDFHAIKVGMNVTIWDLKYIVVSCLSVRKPIMDYRWHRFWYSGTRSPDF